MAKRNGPNLTNAGGREFKPRLGRIGHDRQQSFLSRVDNVRNNGKVSFGYDRAYQPTSMNGTGPDGTGFTGNFTYDGNLKRVKQVMGGKTIYSVYGQGGSLIYREDVTNNKKTNYMPFGIRLVNGAPEYTHKDHLGSPVASTNASGTVLWREIYAPYGDKLVNPAANRDNEGYTGHVDDASSGLTYMQARYYDPNIGRFLVNDPVGFVDSGFNPQMFNRYSYTWNDPVNLTDPDGKCPFCIGAAIGGGLAALGNSVAQFKRNGNSFENFSFGELGAATVTGLAFGATGGAAAAAGGITGAATSTVIAVTGGVTVKAINDQELTLDTVKDVIVDEMTGKVAGKALKAAGDVPNEVTDVSIAVDGAVKSITEPEKEDDKNSDQEEDK